MNGDHLERQNLRMNPDSWQLISVSLAVFMWGGGGYCKYWEGGTVLGSK